MGGVGRAEGCDEVYVSFRTRTDIDEADVQEWLATLPEDLFIFVELEVPRRRIELPRRPSRQPPTILFGWADARRIFELRKYLREWVDDGSLNTETYLESAFTGDYFVATQTWLLTNAPRNPGTATECVDPERHHAYLARYLTPALASR